MFWKSIFQNSTVIANQHKCVWSPFIDHYVVIINFHLITKITYNVEIVCKLWALQFLKLCAQSSKRIQYSLERLGNGISPRYMWLYLYSSGKYHSALGTFMICKIRVTVNTTNIVLPIDLLIIYVIMKFACTKFPWWSHSFYSRCDNMTANETINCKDRHQFHIQYMFHL